MLDDPPAAAHAYDDEFSSAVLDPKWVEAGNGAGVDTATGIDPYAAVGAANHRRSLHGYRPGWYMGQPATAGFLSINQAVAPPADCFMWARFSFAMRYSTNADNDFEVGLSLCANAAGVPDYANRVICYISESGAGVVNVFAGKVVAGVFTITRGQDKMPGPLGVNVDARAQQYCYAGIAKTGTTYNFCVGTPDGHWMFLTSQVHASAMAWLGISMGNSSGAAPGSMIMGCDFVRFKASRFLP